MRRILDFSDLQVLIDFMERQWLPATVKEAYDRVKVFKSEVEIDTAGEIDTLRAENERLKQRCHPHEAFL